MCRRNRSLEYAPKEICLLRLGVVATRARSLRGSLRRTRAEIAASSLIARGNNQGHEVKFRIRRPRVLNRISQARFGATWRRHAKDQSSLGTPPLHPRTRAPVFHARSRGLRLCRSIGDKHHVWMCQSEVVAGRCRRLLEISCVIFLAAKEISGSAYQALSEGCSSILLWLRFSREIP